MAYKKKEQS